VATALRRGGQSPPPPRPRPGGPGPVDLRAGFEAAVAGRTAAGLRLLDHQEALALRREKEAIQRAILADGEKELAAREVPAPSRGDGP